MPRQTHALRLSDVLAAMSAALDLTEGVALGHAARSCLIGMRLADELDLPPSERSSLFYALLLKDVGCSSNAARLASLFRADDQTLKREHKLIDWASLGPAFGYALKQTAPGANWLERARRVLMIALKKEEVGRRMIEIRCERGGEILRMLGMSEATVTAVQNLDEHWDGKGHPKGLRGEEIPLGGRILCMAQTVEVFLCAYGLEAVTTMLVARRGRWFDPRLVHHMARTLEDTAFWESLQEEDPALLVARVEPADQVLELSEEELDTIALAFARVIDAKSPWTSDHSARVAARSLAVAETLGLAPEAAREVWRAALLHDIGMLSVSSLVFEKPGPLNEAEWETIRRHPEHARCILGRVGAFGEVAEIAAAHHEHLDGTGYPRGLSGDQLSLPARILAVTTRAEAMLADRSYRPACTWPEMLEQLEPLVGRVLDRRCYEALAACSSPM